LFLKSHNRSTVSSCGPKGISIFYFICRSLFVPILLDIVLSVLLLFTDFDYFFGIFNLCLLLVFYTSCMGINKAWTIRIDRQAEHRFYPNNLKMNISIDKKNKIKNHEHLEQLISVYIKYLFIEWRWMEDGIVNDSRWCVSCIWRTFNRLWTSLRYIEKKHLSNVKICRA
jgi:hypothetical protein